MILSTNAVDFQGIWHEWAGELRAIDGIGKIHRTPGKKYPECLNWYRSSVDPEKAKRS